MNLKEMTDFAARVIQDNSFDPWQDITPMINAAILEIAAYDDGTAWNRVRLPGLIATSQLTFVAGGENAQPLPDNYHHDLFEVRDVSGVSAAPINIRTSSQILYDLHGFVFSPGPIEDVAVDGNLLWAMPEVAEDQTIQIRYYRKPAALVNDEDVPEGIPAHLHQPVIVNYVLRNIFTLIEEGIDENKPNTKLYTQKFVAEGLAPLIAYCEGAPKTRPVIRRHVGWF